ncbi:MAG TPA: FAD-dependent oxidoreductase [Pseudoduganella sp.]
MSASPQADVLIIGGGIMGASTAFFLRKRGVSVTLLERGLVGQQASGVNFGNVRRQGRFLPQLPLANRANEIWYKLNELLGEDAEFLPTGHLRCAYDAEREALLTDDMSALDAGAIEAVANEAWPPARNADEMQEALTQLACISRDQAAANNSWGDLLSALAAGGRVTRLHLGAGTEFWVPLERLAYLQPAYLDAVAAPPLAMLERLALNGDESWTRDAALVELLRARLSGFGPQPAAAVASSLELPESTVVIALTQLESEGYVMRGLFTPQAAGEEWCERQLLARIHRYTINTCGARSSPSSARTSCACCSSCTCLRKRSFKDRTRGSKRSPNWRASKRPHARRKANCWRHV